MTAASCEKPPTSDFDSRLQAIEKISITPAAISAASRNVSFTRWPCRAPKFCPATGATANPSATTGMKPAWTTRMPIPKPAWAAAPNGRATEYTMNR